MSLENRYRRLLRAYPRSYRQRRGEEMLSTLLDTAAPGQTHPTRGDVADLLSGAVRERLGMHAVPGFAAGLRIAGPMCLALAAAYSLSAWVAGDRGAASTVVTAAWLLAATAFVIAGRPAATFGLAAAWLATLGATLASLVNPVTIVSPDQLIEADLYASLSLPLTCGTVALLAAVVPRSDAPPVIERAGVLVAVVGAAVATGAVDGADRPVAFESLTNISPTWATWWLLVPAAALVAGVVQLAARRTTGWLWAAALLFVPVPLTGMSALNHLVILPTSYLFEIIRNPLSVVLAAGVAVAVVLSAARATGRAAGVGDRAVLATAGSLCLDVAAVGLLVMYVMSTAVSSPPEARPGWTDGVIVFLLLAAAVARRLRPAWLSRVLIGLALVPYTIMIMGGTNGGFHPEVYLTLVPLLAVALTAPTRRGTARTAEALVVTAAVATATVVALAEGWSSAVIQTRLGPVIGGFVLAPVLWWAGRAVVTIPRGLIGAAVAYVAAALWVLALIFAPRNLGPFVVAVSGGLVLLLVGRLIHRLAARRPAPPAPDVAVP